MSQRVPELPSQTQEVVSYEDDVYAWMYLDQVDGLLRYEAFVIGYDASGSPSTLELVFEEGAFELTDFPQLLALLPRSLQERARCRRERSKGDEATAFDPDRVRSSDFVPWELTQSQWDRLHAFFEDQERRLKRECRVRWTRRLRALGYDVIPNL